MATQLAVIHLAGPWGQPVPLVQECSRCHAVLVDMRNASVQLREGQTVEEAIGHGFAEGMEVLVATGNPTFKAALPSLRADRDTSDEVQCG